MKKGEGPIRLMLAQSRMLLCQTMKTVLESKA
ncbi:hypothetical protein BH20ACT23_BH20ACT23_20870 [soil metagenome]